MSTTYGKWEVEALQYGLVVRRKVTREAWPLGFHWKRERWELAPYDGGAPHRLCRVLNGEPEPAPPEVKLSDFRNAFLSDEYRFSTEALKAELVRRDAETLWYLSERDRRSGTNRRKPVRAAKKGRGK